MHSQNSHHQPLLSSASHITTPPIPSLTSHLIISPFLSFPPLPSHSLFSPLFLPLPSPLRLLDREGIDPLSSTPRKPSSSNTLRPGTLTSLEELKNTHNLGRYQRVAGWNLDPAQGVTALSGVNSVQSPLIFCATTDRKIHVLDAAVGG